MDDGTASALFGIAAKPVQNLVNGPSQEDMANAVEIAMEQERQAQAQQQNRQPQQMKKGGVAGKLATRGYGISKHGKSK
jgi:membrane protease subunit (stomatin/prohibitin family)